MCAICDFRVDFDVDHPDTLTVAVATRRALDDFLLAPPRSEGPLGDMRQRLAAIGMLQTLQTRLQAALPGAELLALPDFYVLLIESRTWGYFHPTEQGFDPTARPDPPRVARDGAGERDAVLVAADMTVAAILAGKLAFGEALGRAMMVLDAGDGPRDRLRTALGAALPDWGFSRLVCGGVAAEGAKSPGGPQRKLRPGRDASHAVASVGRR